MSISYEIYFNFESFPSFAEIEKFAQKIEPTFKFEEPYDFLNEMGFCPCVLKEQHCGFEWELITPEEEFDFSEFNREGQLIFRSSRFDGACAALLGGSIAYLCKGGVQENDSLIMEEKIVEWIKKEFKSYFINKKIKSPEKQMETWLSDLKGKSVKQMVRLVPEEPRLSVVFETNIRLRGVRWSLFSTEDSYNFSTINLPPRDLSAEQIQALMEATRKLREIFKSSIIEEAKFNPNTFQIQISFQNTNLIFYPAGTYKPKNDIEALFMLSDEWDCMDNKSVTVKPDIEENKLIFD